MNPILLFSKKGKQKFYEKGTMDFFTACFTDGAAKKKIPANPTQAITLRFRCGFYQTAHHLLILIFNTSLAKNIFMKGKRRWF